jgi:hypothetical protein
MMNAPRRASVSATAITWNSNSGPRYPGALPLRLIRPNGGLLTRRQTLPVSGDQVAGVPGKTADVRAQIDDAVPGDHMVELAGELSRGEQRAVQGAARVRRLVEVIENEFPLHAHQLPVTVHQFARPVVLLGLLLAQLSGHDMPPFGVGWRAGPGVLPGPAAGARMRAAPYVTGAVRRSATRAVALSA